jgi:hypothetical protein
MASVAYLRRQAEVCLRLPLASSDNEVSNRPIMMAKEYNERVLLSKQRRRHPRCTALE